GGLASLDDAGFAALDPVQWPAPAVSGGEALPLAPRLGHPSPRPSPRKERGEEEEKRFFDHGSFFTPDRKARFVAPERPAPREATSPAFAFRLNTGRVRDQWHTMTRTGRSPRLG